MIFNFLYLLIIVLIGLSIPSLFSRTIKKKDKLELNKLFFYHLLLGTAYFSITNNGGGDAWGYWKVSQGMNWDQFVQYLYEAQGTYFMYSLNFIPGKILGMTFFTNTMLFSLIGYIGFVFFYIIAIEIIPYNSKYKGYKMFPLIFYLPNLHFWSAGLGKDTVLFLCIGMFAYGILNIMKRIPLLALSILLSYLLRPHITLFLLLSFSLAFLLEAKASTVKRLSILLILAGGCVVILPTVLKFSKIEEASVESFNQFSKAKAAALSNSGSSVDISSYPFPLKVVTFLYRPFFFDVRGIPALIASCENLLLLILTIKLFKENPVAVFRSSPLLIKAFVFFLVIGTLAFSQSLGNLGIMIRMRNMFLPGLLIYFLWSFSYARHQLIISQKKLS